MPATSGDVYILIPPDGRSLIPVCDRAFQYGRGNEKSLNRLNVGSLVVSSNGRVRQITEIEKVGLYGTSFLSRALSQVTRDLEIVTHFRDFELSVEDLKRRVCRVLTKYWNDHEENFNFSASKEVIILRIDEADSTEEVFAILEVPQAEDCLDQL